MLAVDWGSREMWTQENRGRYDCSKLRYPSDLTDDEEWALIVTLIPPAKRGGNKRTVNEREIVNGLMYILSTGCPLSERLPLTINVRVGRHCLRICRLASQGQHLFLPLGS
jgi:hypothetical protein